MQDFKRLDVWMCAHQLALDSYRATSRFPRAETYALSSQIRRAALSVTANIAEGSGCASQRAFARYLDMARASAVELEAHLLLARDLGLIEMDMSNKLVEGADRVRRMLTGLIRRVRQS